MSYAPPCRWGSASRIHQNTAPKRESASKIHQPKGVCFQISSTKKESHQPKRGSAQNSSTCSPSKGGSPLKFSNILIDSQLQKLNSKSRFEKYFDPYVQSYIKVRLYLVLQAKIPNTLQTVRQSQRVSASFLYS